MQLQFKSVVLVAIAQNTFQRKIKISISIVENVNYRSLTGQKAWINGTQSFKVPEPFVLEY